MKRFSIVFVALVALFGSGVQLYAAGSETFTDAASASGTYKRPLLIVDGRRYELKASDKADASVAATLAKFSKGDTGTYTVVGTRGTVNRGDGIAVDRITPAAQPLPNAGPATSAVPGIEPTEFVQATPAAGAVAPDAALSAGPQNQYKIYDFAEKAIMRPAAYDHDVEYIKSWRLAIPTGATTVRGILVVANCTGGDSRDWYKNGTAYEAFINLHDFAFIGSEGFGPHFQNYEAFLHALASWAKASGHPELVNVPYVTTGVSAGGGFASTLVTKCPEKVLAAVPQCARLNLTVFELPKYDPKNPVPVPDAVLRVPVLDMPVDGGPPYLTPNLNAHRPTGAPYSWTVTWGHGDEYCGQEVLAMPYLEAALKLRYPAAGDVRKGPLKLKDLDPMSGWIADNTTWKSGLTSICPASKFQGDIHQSSWLMNQDIAHIYRAYATYDRPLKITSPAPQTNIFTPIHTAGSSVTIQVDASTFPGWKTLEFYDGAKLLGTVTSGLTRFKATNLTPGFHTFSVLGTDSSGKIVTSDCGMVAVRK